jgi:putative ABC transport system permease protein
MLKHLFKLIWNKKKQNLLLISEMFVSFLVLFAVFTLIVYYYQNYRKVLGFDFENVWVANYEHSINTNNADSVRLLNETIAQTLKALQGVKELSFVSANVPFSSWTHQSGFDHNNQKIRNVNIFNVDDSYKDLLEVKLLEGRWFSKQDAVSKNKPVVINQSLKEVAFGNEQAIGKLIGDEKSERKTVVIGVIQDMKIKGDYAEAGLAIFERADTNSYKYMNNILLKVSEDADAGFEGRLYKALSNTLKNANVEIEHLAHKRKNINYFALVPMITLLIVAGFLVINVALGLFGVLWYNINRRKGEIGLRMAVGASGSSVSNQLIWESLILATFSLIIGSFFAIQFPLLNVFNLRAGVYISALVLAIIFIYLLVIICSLYPGRQAAGIYPAVALHED